MIWELEWKPAANTQVPETQVAFQHDLKYQGTGRKEKMTAKQTPSDTDLYRVML